MPKLQEMKDRLAHVKRASWHYQLVREMGRPSRKACAYYWWDVPISLLKCAVRYTLYGVVVTIAFFLGFSTSDKTVFTSYKVRRNGTRKIMAPWEVVAAAAVFYASFRGITFLMDVNVMGLSRLVALFLLAFGSPLIVILVVMMLHAKIRTSALKIKGVYEKVCPDLIVED